MFLLLNEDPLGWWDIRAGHHGNGEHALMYPADDSQPSKRQLLGPQDPESYNTVIFSENPDSFLKHYRAGDKT